MGLFKQIAEPLVSRGVPVIPLRPKTKIAFLNNWQELASTDIQKVQQWDEEYPDANGACVAFAKPEGIWFLEIDKPGFIEVIEKQTGQTLPPTFAVRSSPGRGHFYFRQTPASIAMGNKQGKDENGKEAWSARVDNRYVVAPGSFHPTSGKQYETLRDADITPAPDWLIEWCQKSGGTQVATGHADLDDTAPIIEGGRNSALTSLLGRARQVMKMDREQLEAFGLSINQKRCVPPLPESEVKTIAASISNYKITEAQPVVMGGKNLSAAVSVSISEQPTPEPIEHVSYPKFPDWVMKGTSLYDGYIGPMCASSSRIPEFMFMPGVLMLLNFIGTKVRIEYKNTMPSFYMCLIGEKGRTHKSSSVTDMVDYMKSAGMAAYHSTGSKNSEGKTIVFTSGSTEGLALEMQRMNCKNSVLYYDELSLLVNKATIQNSSMLSHLLSMHESGQWSNGTKARREIFTFEPHTYCASLVCCTTPRGFEQNWSKIGGETSGMDDRFFFLMPPEVPREFKLQHAIDPVEPALETRRRVDAALTKQVYSIDDTTLLQHAIQKLGVRAESRAEKLALYFAIDLKLDSIDNGCIERALAICKYEDQVKNYLQVFESVTREGAVQNRIVRALQRNSGAMRRRDLERSVKPLYYGISVFRQCIANLESAGYITRQGTGNQNDPEMIILMRNVSEKEE